MSYNNLKHALTDPIIPYNSLYIDIFYKDLLKAVATPKLIAKKDPFVPSSYDPSIKCYGCRVRQIHGLTLDKNDLQYESCNDISMRLNKFSWSPQFLKNETSTSIHYDLAALWARPYINQTNEESITSPKTLEMIRSHPLCDGCSLQSTRDGQQSLQQASSNNQGNNNHPISSITPKPIPPHAYNVLGMLSVRSALSSWLLYKDFPKGSIVIFSAVNIPDMTKVIYAHGLVPLPIDIDTNTTMIDIEVLEKTIQHYGVVKSWRDDQNQPHHSTQIVNETKSTHPKVCAVIVSYIFGIRNDVSNLINIVQKYDLPFIEDCAEAYTEANFVGHPDSDLSLFSFGSIKNCTAFGGGIARAKSFEDYYGMLYIQSLWPKYTNQKYFDKVKKMIPISIALNSPMASETTIRGAKLVGIDIKEFVVSKLRGFPGEMIFGIRHQPPAALTYMLRHRIAHATDESLTMSAKKGLFFEGLIQRYDINVEIVGRYAEKRGYWLYPFIVTNPEEITNALATHGVQVYRGATQLTCLQVPEELQKYATTTTTSSITTIPAPIKYANQLMSHVVYLPLSKRIPEHVMETIAHHLQAICGMKGKGDNTIIPYPEIDPGVKRQSEIQTFKMMARL